MYLPSQDQTRHNQITKHNGWSLQNKLDLCRLMYTQGHFFLLNESWFSLSVKSCMFTQICKKNQHKIESCSLCVTHYTDSVTRGWRLTWAPMLPVNLAVYRTTSNKGWKYNNDTCYNIWCSVCNRQADGKIDRWTDR